MPQTHQERRAARALDSWTYPEAASAEVVTVEASGGLATSPAAVLGLALGWVTVGLLVAWYLARRGHAGQTMGALGAGFGPLMIPLAIDAVKYREGAAEPVVLDPGANGGGDLDVLVLLQGPAESVSSVGPTLESVRDDVRSLTLARAVAFEWLDGDLDNAVVYEAATTLERAARFVPVPEPALVLVPGTVAGAPARWARRQPCDLVLIADNDGDDHRARSRHTGDGR